MKYNAKRVFKKTVVYMSIFCLVLISAVLLSSCSLGILTGRRIDGIVHGTYDYNIKLPQGENNNPSTSQTGEISEGTNTSTGIVGIGSLNISENPIITENRTEFTNTVERVSRSVVEINTETASYSWGGQYIQKGAGSGVIISHNSDKTLYYIVTNNHVIESAQSILVRLSDGTEYKNARLIATDALTDVALLEISTEAGTELTTAVFSNSASRVAKGQDIFVVGNPLGMLGGSVTKGIISKTERSINIDGISMQLMQIDASVNPGNSGGGLFDLNGDLIGIVNSKYTDESVEGIGFAIPLSTVRNVVCQLAEQGYVGGRPWLGFETTDKSYGTSSFLTSTSVIYPTIVGDTNVSGVYKDNSGDEKVFNFAKDDIIYAVNDHKVSSSAGLMSRLSVYHIGDTVTVTVIRIITESSGSGFTRSRQEQYDVEVKLTEYKPTVTVQ